MNQRIGFSLTSMLLLGAVLGGGAPSVQAADYDIFMNPGVSDASRPNVLFIMDNTANWSQSDSTVKTTASTKSAFAAPKPKDDGGTKFDAEKTALSNFFTALAPDPGDPAEVDVGLEMFSETGAGNDNPSGGYIRYAVRPMENEDARALASLISNLDGNDDKGNAAEYALSLHEAYLYFIGLTARSGLKVKTDAGAPVLVTDPSPYLAGDTGAWKVVPPIYASPSALDVCGKNYIIFISNGAPDNGENNTAEALLDSLGGLQSGDPIPLPDGKTREDIWADEYARFLAENGIYTYVIDVLPTTTGQGPANTALLKSMAERGEGRYFVVTADGGDAAAQLEEIVKKIFDEIQAVNSVFAASALPISVNVRGTNENQVYLGMFRPDERRLPRWLGNLKLYQLDQDTATGEIYLVDTRGEKLQSSVTGFVVNDAVSFWTHTSDYWEFSKRGTPPSASDSPDGEVVEKGAAAQSQRDCYEEDTCSRNFYTCIGCPDGSDLTAQDQAFKDSNALLSTGVLGVADAVERTALIEWMKGADNVIPAERPVDRDLTDPFTVRPSVQGDIVHSSPAVVNYGNEIIAFYGSNEGLYRAVVGGKDAATGSGKELWAFIAEEFLGNLSRQRLQLPLIKTPQDNPTQLLSTNRDYFFDGRTAVYRLDNDDDGLIEPLNGDKVYIYLSARRGGRFFYALDVTTPRLPKLLWKKTPTDLGWAELGQAWSVPEVVKLNIGGTVKPVLIMGAGYDVATEDVQPSGTATMGRGIFAVDAVNGDMLWQAGPSPAGAAYNLTVASMTYPIPSDIPVVDIDGDGLADVGYVGDTYGRLWRINFDDPDGNGVVSNWRVSQFADLHNTASKQDKHKFLYQPDLVPIGADCDATKAAAGAVGVIIGSGDREHPLAMSIYNDMFNITPALDETDNQVYMVVDDDPQSSSVTKVTLADLTNVTNSATVDLSIYKGWYLNLEHGEKVVGSPLTLNGQLFFGTSLPPLTQLDPVSCTGSLGVARAYMVQYCNAAPLGYTSGSVDSGDRYESIPGGGLLPSPVPAIFNAPDGSIHFVVSEGLNVFDAGTAGGGSNSRTFWYREKGD